MAQVQGSFKEAGRNAWPPACLRNGNPISRSRMTGEASLRASVPHLQYSGKKSEAEVLATPPAEYCDSLVRS